MSVGAERGIWQVWDPDHTRFQGNDPRLQGPGRRSQRYAYAQWLPRAVLDPFEPAYERARRIGAIRHREQTARRVVSLF